MTPSDRSLALAAAAAMLAAAAAAAERPPIVGVSHVSFHVSDLYRLGDAARPERVCFKISDRQFVEILAGLPAGQEDRLSHVAFETIDVLALRAYLEEKGVKTSAGVVDEAGDRGLRLTDPDGHALEFVQ